MAELNMVELTMVVLEPAEGAWPVVLPNDGVFGAVALNKTYPFAVAPDPGKVAVDQERLICSPETAVALMDVASAVGGLDKVRKLDSLLNPVVAFAFVAYPA